ALDEGTPLVRARVVEEVARLGSGWYLADQVEADAAEKLAVVGDLGWAHIRCRPAGREHVVDPRGQARHVRSGSSPASHRSSAISGSRRLAIVSPGSGGHEDEHDARS